MMMKIKSVIAFKHFRNIVFLSCVLLMACEAPPMDTKQQGFRGLAIEKVSNTETLERLEEKNIVPVATPIADSSGPKASDIYQNVQVLGDLSVAEFTRLMASMTEWIAPTEGCGYCHNLANLASDDIYTKKISRVMLKMTMNANTEWTSHVGDVGVTCYTCHRGNPIPEETWSADPGPRHATALNRSKQNIASATVAYSSLPFDALTRYLDEPNEIKVIGNKALPGSNDRTTMQTEATYGLMMHMSDSLGVNCTHCHNSRAFSEWDQSSPARTNAWHAIRHVRKINNDYIKNIADDLPDGRQGPLGDNKKVNCKTCHQGLNKPLYGAPMAKDFPSLSRR